MSNYTKNKYVEDANNSWNIVYKLVNNNEKVLDIGCSSGNFGAELIASKNCNVDGIDIDPKDIDLAKHKLNNAYLMNVESESLSQLTEKYDAILMMDVIEHLKDPITSLKKISKLLKPQGRLIFSVPNMAHISVRLDLLLGKFTYRQVGLLDFTHLHFYTNETLAEVLESAGYSITHTKSSTVTYPKELLRLKLNEAGLEPKHDFIKKLSDTAGNIYQLIGVAELNNSPVAHTFPSINPHEEHYKQIENALNEQSKAAQLKDQHIQNLESTLNHITSSKSYKIAHHVLKPYRKTQSAIKKTRK